MSSPAGTPQADRRAILAVASRPPVGVVEQAATAYTAGWTIVLAVAAVCALVPAARSLAHHELALKLHVHLAPDPPPTVIHALWLLQNNIRATGWPLVPAMLRAHRYPLCRRLVHAAVTISFLVNVLPVAAALGVYRARIVAFLPHLPLELYAATTGPTCWLLAARNQLGRRQLAGLAASILVALAGAAFLETWAVPHH
jgi:hypothetical protein